MGESCRLQGNADLYGLGVRAGVYSQLLATILANHALPDALQGAVDTNIIFLLAILTAMIKTTAENRLSAIEAFVLLQIILTFLLSVVKIDGVRWIFFALVASVSGTTKNFSDAHFKVSRMGTYWRQCIGTVASSYNLWFWYYGRTRLDHAQACNFQIFYFARFDATGVIAHVFQWWSVAFALYDINGWIIVILWTKEDREADPVRHHDSLRTKVKSFLSRVFEPMDRIGSTGFGPGLRDGLVGELGSRLKARKHLIQWHALSRRGLIIWDMCVLLWTILTVELSLSWSQVYGVNEIASTSQLIPLVIGLSGLLQNLLAFSYARVINEVTIPTRNLVPGIQRSDGGNLKPSFWQYSLCREYLARFDIDTDLAETRSFDRRYEAESTNRTSARRLDMDEKMPSAPEPVYVRPRLAEVWAERRNPNASLIQFEAYGDGHGSSHVFADRMISRNQSLTDVEHVPYHPHKARLTRFKPDSLPKKLGQRKYIIYRRNRLGRIRRRSRSSSSSRVVDTAPSVRKRPEISSRRLALPAFQDACQRRGREPLRSFPHLDVDFESGGHVYKHADDSDGKKGLKLYSNVHDILTHKRKIGSKIGGSFEDGYDWNGPAPHVVEYRFDLPRLRAWKARESIRSVPWSQQRVFVYYLALACLYLSAPVWLCCLAPFELAHATHELRRIRWRKRRASKPMPTLRQLLQQLNDGRRLYQHAFIYGLPITAHTFVLKWVPDNSFPIKGVFVWLHLQFLLSVFFPIMKLAGSHVIVQTRGGWLTLTWRQKLLTLGELMCSLALGPVWMYGTAFLEWRNGDADEYDPSSESSSVSDMV